MRVRRARPPLRSFRPRTRCRAGPSTGSAPNAWVVSADDPERLRLVLTVVRDLALLAQNDGDPPSTWGQPQTAIAHGVQLVPRFDEVMKHTGAD
jgi:hypothetical protein